MVLVTSLTGVNFMEKTISIRNTEITFSIWDLGGEHVTLMFAELCSQEQSLEQSLTRHFSHSGQREFVNMLPLVW